MANVNVNRAAMAKWLEEQEKKRQQEAAQQGQQAQNVAVPYQQYSNFLSSKLGLNSVTTKLNDFLSPAATAQRVDKETTQQRLTDNPYLNHSKILPQAGTVARDMYEYGRTGKMNFQAASALNQLNNWDAFVKMGLNDTAVANAARNTAYNQLQDAMKKGKKDKVDVWQTYADRNPDVGMFDFKAGSVDEKGLDYETLMRRTQMQQKADAGDYDNWNTVRAGQYSLMSDTYLQQAIDQQRAAVERSKAIMDNPDSLTSDLWKVQDTDYWANIGGSMFMGQEPEAEDLAAFANTLYPRLNLTAEDFGPDADPSARLFILNEAEALWTKQQKQVNGKSWRAEQKEKLEGNYLAEQQLLHALEKEQQDRYERIQFGKKYATGDSEFHPESLLGLDPQYNDFADSMLYMNLVALKRANWDDKGQAWLQPIADVMNDGRLRVFDGYINNGYSALLPEELELVNRVWNETHDPEEVMRVMKAYETPWLNAAAEIQANEAARLYDQAGVFGIVPRLGAYGMGTLENAYNMFNQLTGNGEGAHNTNSAAWYWNRLNENLYGRGGTLAGNTGGDVGEWLGGEEGRKIGEKAGRGIYEVANAVGEEAVDALFAAPFGGIGTKAGRLVNDAVNFANAAGGDLRANYEKGITDWRAGLSAMGSGALALGAEQLPTDVWLNTSKATSGKKLIGRMALAEGMEEGVEFLGEKAKDYVLSDVGGTLNDDERAYAELRNAGASHEEALAAVREQNFGELGHSMLIGGLAGGAMGAGGAMAIHNANARTGKRISRTGNPDAVLNVAMGLEEGTEARQLAETLTAQGKKGKKMSNGQLGRLYAATAMELDAQSAAVVTDAMNDAVAEQMVAKGEDEAVARRAAPILAKQLRGDKLGKADMAVLAESKTGTEMLEELNRYEDGGKAKTPTKEQIKRASEVMMDMQVPAKMAKGRASLVARAAVGDTLTAKEQATLEDTPYAQEAIEGVRRAGRPDWLEGTMASSMDKYDQGMRDVAGKQRQLHEAFRPSDSTAIAKSADKVKSMVSEDHVQEGVHDTSVTAMGSKEAETIQRIEKNEKTGALELVLADESGKERKASYRTLNFKSGSTGHVIAHSIDNAAGNAEMANLMAQGYTGGDSAQYIAEFSKAYRAGFDHAAVGMDSTTRYNTGIAKEAYKLGQKQAREAEKTRLANIGKGTRGSGVVVLPEGVREDGLDKQQQDQVALVRQIAKATGINFTFFRSEANEAGYFEAENGSYDAATNSIRIDLNAGKYREADPHYAILRTAAHEITHYIEANSKDNYAQLRQYVADELARKGEDFNALVQEKIDRSPVPLTRGGAIAEVVADGCEMMLRDSKAVERLMQKDPTLFEKVKQVLADFIEKIREAFRNIDPESREAKALMEQRDGMLRYANELVELWDKGLVEAVEAVQGNTLEQSGIVVEGDTAYAVPQASVRTWAASDWATKKDEMAKQLAKATGTTEAKAAKWITDVNSISSLILNDPLRLDYISSPFGSSFKSNPEYGGSVDMSTLCPKRRLATGTLDAIQERLGDVAMTRDDFLRLRAMMGERGYEVACGLCFVESSRANLSKYNKEFIDQYNSKHPDAEHVTMADMNTIDGLESIRSARPEVYEEYLQYMNKLAQRKPKLFEKRTEYNGEILKKFRNDNSVKAKNDNGGLRLQSFSDFEIVHLIDMMQVITDMAQVGLAGQAYTKVPEFAWALGNTGLKINLSLIAKGVDENGKLIFNDIEGMNHVEAKKLRDAYSKNVGTIVVTFTDEQLIAAMNDDFVDFIIPFHRSQWKKTDYRILGLPEGTKDYTLHQNEKLGRKRVKENFKPMVYWDFTISGKENAQVYLDMCNAEGRVPKFAKFLQKNADGTYSLKADGSTDGYWKLLIDFKMYDNDGNGSEQLPVRPDFNMEQATRMLEDYKGGHETLPVAWDVVDDFVEEYKGKRQYSPRYDIKKPFDQQVDDWMNGKLPQRETLLLGRTPLVLRQVGLSDLPMTVDQKHMGYMVYGNGGKANHMMPVDMVKRLPELLEDPVAVIESQTRPNDSVMVLIDATVNGDNVMAAVNIDSNGVVSGRTIDSNHMVSAQPRANAVSKLLLDAVQKENGNTIAVYYLDKKRGVSILKRAGVQFPGVLNRGGLIHSIHDAGSPVNRKYLSQTDSTQFSKWFGSSKVVNKDGTPKVVYHQTATNFTVFDNSNPVAGMNDSETPNGFFFKDNDHDIGLGGTKQMAVYLKMEKPLHFRNREEANAWYRKNVPGYNSLHKEFDAALAEYEPKFKAIEDEQFANWTSDERVDELFEIEEELIKQMGAVETEYRSKLREMLNAYFLNNESGYDGIELDYDGHRWVNGVRENVHTYIVFNPTQIKSATDNVGTFDSDEPDIRYSLRTAIPATTRDYLLTMRENSLSTDGEKDAMKRYKAVVEELTAKLTERGEQRRLMATETGDELLKAKAREEILTKQIARLEERAEKYERSNVFAPMMAEAKAVLEANRQLELGRPKETVLKGMGGKIRNAEEKLLRFRERLVEAESDRKETNALRSSIIRKVKKLDKLRRNESDYKHVPEELKPMVDALVSAFAENSAMVFDAKRAERLAAAYAKLKELDSDLAEFYTEDVQAMIEYVSMLLEQNRGKPFRKADLQTVESIVGNIYKLVRKSNEAFINGRSVAFAEMAERTAKAMLERNDARYLRGTTELAKGLDDLIRNGNMLPVYYFDNLGNQQLRELGYDILRGQDKYGLWAHDDRETMSGLRQQYNYHAWVSDKPITFTIGDERVTLTKEQALWMYATAKREASNELAQTHHLDEGGIVFEKGAEKSEDKLHDPKKRPPIKVSQEAVQQIVATLTEEQMGYADAVVKHLSTTVGDRGNDTSMEMYGYRKYREQYYFPYKTAADQRHQTSVSNAVSATDDARLKHQSFTNPLKKGANTPLVLGNFSDVAVAHMNSMNTYAAMVIPVENMNRVLNRKVGMQNGSTTTIRALMEQKYGESTKRYLENLLRDLNGGVQVDKREGFTGKMTNIYKAGAVVGSMSVVYQQWTSIFRATAMINPKYFVTQAPIFKGEWDELAQYSGIASIKDMGRFDVGIGRSGAEWIGADADDFTVWKKAQQMFDLKDRKTARTRWDDVFNFLPGWADRVTWAQIWRAVKAEQADLHPNMDRSSDAFLSMCAERFNDVINHTQVYDSVMTRSQLMRGKDALSKMVTAFAAEPTLTANMLYDAAHNPEHKGVKERVKHVAGVTTAVVLSQVFASAMQALASAWRDDDDERKGLEKLLDRFGGNVFDNLNPFTMFPVVRDIYTTLQGEYDVERGDMEFISEVARVIKKVQKGNMTAGQFIEEVGGTVAKIFGIPLKNVMRDLRAAYNAVTSDWTAPAASNASHSFWRNRWGYDTSNAAYYERLVNAINSGDKKLESDLRLYLTESMGKDEDAIATGARSYIKDLVQDGVLGLDEAVKLIDEHFPYDKGTTQAYKTVMGWLSETELGESDEANSSAYRKLQDAMLAGNSTDYKAARQEMVKYGYAEKTIDSEMKSYVKKSYKDGEITWEQAEKLFRQYFSITDKNDLFWLKEELDYKGDGTWGEYKPARDALLSGDKKTFLAEKSKLLSHGKEAKGLTSAIGALKDELLELYDTNPSEARKLREMLVWAYMECGKTKQNANTLVDGWFDKK